MANKPIYDIADIIMQQLLFAGVETDTVIGSDSVEFHIKHKERKIHFFMQYEEEEG